MEAKDKGRSCWRNEIEGRFEKGFLTEVKIESKILQVFMLDKYLCIYSSSRKHVYLWYFEEKVGSKVEENLRYKRRVA